MSTCHITRLSDQGTGNGMRGDLRYCINKANANTGPDVIDFNVAGTINLLSALPDLSSDIDIEGPGPNQMTVRNSGTGPFRIFNVTASAVVRLYGLSIADGYLVAGANSSGGGILNNGTLEISSCHIVRNRAIGGGGIWNIGRLTMVDTTVIDNEASMTGGGLDNSGRAHVERSTISHNGAVSNTAFGPAAGGGIYSSGRLTIVESTISGNFTSHQNPSFELGGGIHSQNLTLISSTVTNNESANGGGIYAAGTGRTKLHNTIVAGNNASFAPDCLCGIDSSGFNLIGNTQGGSGFAATDLLSVDPLLGPLEDNGGPTWTHALLPGSPAMGPTRCWLSTDRERDHRHRGV